MTIVRLLSSPSSHLAGYALRKPSRKIRELLPVQAPRESRQVDSNGVRQPLEHAAQHSWHAIAILAMHTPATQENLRGMDLA